jgi:hypothetical protein
MAITLGYSQAQITPPLSAERPVFLAGFSRNRRASAVHDDLFVRALSLRLPDQALILAAVDLIGLPYPFCKRCEDRIRQAVPQARLILSCSHTHHGPDTLGLWGETPFSTGADPAYLQTLEETVVTTALKSLEGAVPAGLRVAAIATQGVVKNIRDPHILDRELIALQFMTPDTHRVLATVVNFPCHPETLYPENTHITADYPHYLRVEVENSTHAPCLFLPGALGGMMTPDVVHHSWEEAQHIGERLARLALNSLTHSAFLPSFPLEYLRVDFTIPFQSPLFEMALQNRLFIEPRDVSPDISTQAGLLVIGPAALVHVPGELLPALGLQIKQSLHERGYPISGIIGLANDELGYILPEEAYRYPDDPFHPGEHYEETMSVGPQAGSRVLKVVRELWTQLPVHSSLSS